MHTINTDTEELWRSHLQYVLLTRNCDRVSGSLTPPVTVDYLNIILPPLVFLRTVSVLDESLARYLDDIGQKFVKPYRDDLNGRLQFLNDQGRISYSQTLHALRQRRNEIAHRAASAFDNDSALTWSDVDSAIDTVERVLQDLGLVQERPAFEFHYGRDVDLYLDDPPPEKPDVRLTHHYYYGIKEKDEWQIQFRKSIDFHRFGAS
jgi:hypothetical protein